MAYLAIAEPGFAAADAARIVALRASHDPQHRIVPPHVTLVFPLPLADPTTLLAHARAVAARTRPIRFRLSAANAVDEPATGTHYVFLLPGEGRGAFAALHDALYAGPFAGSLRREMAYQPHVTVGRFASAAPAGALAAALNREGVDMAGLAETVDVIDFDGATVRTIARIPLGA